MLSRLLPQRIDNGYRGHKLALWLFGLVVFVKSGISLNSIFNGYSVATSADGIPLDTFSPACVRMVVSNFALWGLSQFMLCLLGIVVLVRYRAMVPLMFVLFLFEQLSRKLILQIMPIVKIGKPTGFYVNIGLLTVMILGLVLSLGDRERVPAHDAG